MNLRGVIFDLDGTLIDSGLDFAAIRRDLGFASDQLILETLNAMSAGAEKDRCLAVLREHELSGARRATLMPGADSLLDELDGRGIRKAILTRNSRESTGLSLNRMGLQFSPVMTREDAPAKPDPEGLLHICREWQVAVGEVLFFGDFLFDLQAGRNAGIRTVLYAPDERPEYCDQADFVIERFDEAVALVRQFRADSHASNLDAGRE